MKSKIQNSETIRLRILFTIYLLLLAVDILLTKWYKSGFYLSCHK